MRMETSGSAGKGKSSMGCSPVIVSVSVIAIRSLSTTNRVVGVVLPDWYPALLSNVSRADPVLLVNRLCAYALIRLSVYLLIAAPPPPHSIRSDPLHHQTRRGQDNFDIQQQRPLANVLQIEPHHLFKRKFTADIHLPQAGNAGIHSRPSLRPVRVFAAHPIRSQITGRQRPGTYQAHLPTQHVDQLRQLIQAIATNEAADRSYPRILFDLKNMAVLFIGMGHMAAIHCRIHRPKLEKHEMASASTHTRRLVQDGPCRGELHKSRDDQHGGPQKNKRQRRRDDVKAPLHDLL